MNTTTHAFVTVDLRGLKAALAARAQIERVSVSAVVRRAVGRELGGDEGRVCAAPGSGTAAPHVIGSQRMVKLSIRLTSAEAEQLAAGARRASLSRGAYLAGLVSGIPSLTDPRANRPDHLAALTASTAELSTLARNLHRLAVVLQQRDDDVTLDVRKRLDALDTSVRSHLRVAAAALADLRPARAVPADPALQRRHS